MVSAISWKFNHWYLNMLKKNHNLFFGLLYVTATISFTAGISSPAFSETANLKLADISLCSSFNNAKSKLLDSGFQYNDKKFTKVTDKIRETITLTIMRPAKNKTDLITEIRYQQTGEYSPLEINAMINDEKTKFINEYGQPAECNSFSATVFSFSCYYGDPSQVEPMLTISANKKGVNHSLVIKECN